MGFGVNRSGDDRLIFMEQITTGLLITGSVVAIVMGAGWLLSLAKRDASIVDPIWGMLFVLSAWVLYISEVGRPESGRSVLMLVMVTIWGVRLSAHLTVRKWGEPEDYRYVSMRRRYPPFEWWSLLIVFGMQGAVAVVVSLPIQAVLVDQGTGPLGWLDGLGVAVWTIGLSFEAVADLQLRRFRSDPTNRHAVLDSGLWRYSRHPNYFGDCVVWWGFFLVALAAGAVWTFAGPLIMNYLLVRISGVAMLERTIGDRRPGYADYMRRTNPFLPGRPRP